MQRCVHVVIYLLSLSAREGEVPAACSTAGDLVCTTSDLVVDGMRCSGSGALIDIDAFASAAVGVDTGTATGDID